MKILFLSFTLWRYSFVPLTTLKFADVWSKHLRIFFGRPRQSSVIFGKCLENVPKRSSGLRNNFWKSSEIFGKWSEIFGKWSKTSSLVCLCNKQNITCPLVDTTFIFSCSTQYLTRSLHSLVRYRVEHSKIKFVSTHGHVISSICRQRYFWTQLKIHNRFQWQIQTLS